MNADKKHIAKFQQQILLINFTIDRLDSRLLVLMPDLRVRYGAINTVG